MPFFDFHIHPTLKCMFTPRDLKTDPWKLIDIKKINLLLRLCSDFTQILRSQSNPAQLIESGCNLVCIALFVPEGGMTNNDLIKDQAVKTHLRFYLNPDRLAEMNTTVLKPYPDLVREDLEVLTDPGRFEVFDKAVIPLKRGITYNPANTSALYAAFTVEGCHTLSSTLDRNEIDHNEVLANLDDLCADYPVIAINITHLEQYPFSNHAFGILFVGNDDFRPTGNAISPEGVEIVRHCYRRNILIDTKHMSLGARKMLVDDIRKRSDFNGINQPLICTHAGFTGISYSDIPDYLEYQRVAGKNYSKILWNRPKVYGSYSNYTAFNPSSINLYDEDIIAILESGGIIGLSLDKRILGFSEADSRTVQVYDTTFEEEYISNHELKHFLGADRVGSKMNDFYCITTREVLAGGVVNPEASYYHLCHFMSHILHLVKVATIYGYDVSAALRQVCIGSDFDGLINPIWCCKDVNDLAKFKKMFIKLFPPYARDNETKVTLPPDFDVRQFADRLFFENGRDFLMSRLSIINS